MIKKMPEPKYESIDKLLKEINLPKKPNSLELTPYNKMVRSTDYDGDDGDSCDYDSCYTCDSFCDDCFDL